jgi:hypothetical protein
MRCPEFYRFAMLKLHEGKKALRKLISTLKLHHELIGAMDSISSYLKENNTANVQLMEEALNSIAVIEKLMVGLLNEANKSDVWDCLDRSDWNIIRLF